MTLLFLNLKQDQIPMEKWSTLKQRTHQDLPHLIIKKGTSLYQNCKKKFICLMMFSLLAINLFQLLMMIIEKLPNSTIDNYFSRILKYFPEKDGDGLNPSTYTNTELFDNIEKIVNSSSIQLIQKLNSLTLSETQSQNEQFHIHNLTSSINHISDQLKSIQNFIDDASIEKN